MFWFEPGEEGLSVFFSPLCLVGKGGGGGGWGGRKGLRANFTENTASFVCGPEKKLTRR